jgi:hypothetical protein
LVAIGQVNTKGSFDPVSLFCRGVIGTHEEVTLLNYILTGIPPQIIREIVKSKVNWGKEI